MIITYYILHIFKTGRTFNDNLIIFHDLLVINVYLNTHIIGLDNLVKY